MLAYLTDDEIRYGATRQNAEWLGAPRPVDGDPVGHCAAQLHTAEPEGACNAPGLLTTNPSKRRGGYCR